LTETVISLHRPLTRCFQRPLSAPSHLPLCLLSDRYFRRNKSMSLTLKRACPSTLTIHTCTDTRSRRMMDPEPYGQRRTDKMYGEWNPTATAVTTTTILEEPYPDPTSHRSSSPPKRARNAKNLSLNVVTGTRSTSVSGSTSSSPFRSPRLPSRRPSNLTINIHSLHRHPSTPDLYNSHLPSPSIVQSPLHFSSQKQFPGLTIDMPRSQTDQDRPKMRHTDPSINDLPYAESVERDKAYPDGPRLILEPNIWLYAAPDLQLAKTYDLVVNVAKEVTNPFITSASATLSPESDFEETTPSPYSPYSVFVSPGAQSTPSSVSSTVSPQLPSKSTAENSPTSTNYNDVEYMHIPWDHNSSLMHELPGIVDHILARSSEGKKVLVHCQVPTFLSSTNSVRRLPLRDPCHRPRNEKTQYEYPRSLRIRKIPLTLDRSQHVPNISTNGLRPTLRLRKENPFIADLGTEYGSITRVRGPFVP
jgi:hypothetical protein